MIKPGVSVLLAMVGLFASEGCSMQTQMGMSETSPVMAPQATEDGSRDLSRAELTTPSPIVMPFAQYFSIARQAESNVIDQWYSGRSKTYADDQARTAKCMQDAGFKWFVYDLKKPASEIPGGDTLAIPRLPMKEADASAYGYGKWSPQSAGSSNDESAAVRELNDYLESLGQDGTTAFYKALTDDPGCGKGLLDAEPPQVGASWYSDAINAMQMMFMGDKDGGTTGSLMSQTDMQALNSEWGACMAGKGVLGENDWRLDPDLSGPANAFYIAVATGPDGSRVPADGAGDADVDHSTLTGSAAEVKIAVADFGCRAQTDYIARFAALQAKAETEWVAAHRPMLDQMVSTWEQQGHK